MDTFYKEEEEKTCVLLLLFSVLFWFFYSSNRLCDVLLISHNWESFVFQRFQFGRVQFLRAVFFFMRCFVFCVCFCYFYKIFALRGEPLENAATTQYSHLLTSSTYGPRCGIYFSYIICFLSVFPNFWTIDWQCDIFVSCGMLCDV